MHFLVKFEVFSINDTVPYVRSGKNKGCRTVSAVCCVCLLRGGFTCGSSHCFTASARWPAAEAAVFFYWGMRVAY